MQPQRLLFLLCCLLAPALGFAQSGTGSINGTLLLNDGKPAAAITIQLQGSGKYATTTGDGSFSMSRVPAGNQQLTISLEGYQPVSESLLVREGAASSVTITLGLSGEELAEVTVRGGSPYKAEAPSSSLRLAAPLQEVPQNIQVVTGKVLADQQVTSLSDGLTRNVSGLSRLEHWGDVYARVNMRGGRAAAFRDGMNLTSNWGPLTEDMSFVDHIEFVKGPAGFMMSNGEPSGIYNVVTKKPTGQTKGEASVLLGSYDFYRSTVDLDGRLDKEGKVLYRLNLMGQLRNSFRDYEYNNRYSIAPVISYRIDEKTTLTAQYILQHARMSNIGSYYLFSATGYPQLPRALSLLEQGLEPTTVNEHDVTVNLQHSFNDHWKLTAQLGYFNTQQRGSSLWANSVDSSGGIVRSVSMFDASNIMRFGQVYLNGNFETGAVRHRVLGGLDMGNKDFYADWSQYHALDSAGAEFNIYKPVHGAPVNGYPTFDRSIPLRQRAASSITQQYTGLYVQDELGFWNNDLRLTLAGRYTTVTDNSYGTVSTGQKFTPRVGLSYSINQSTAAYALYDQTFVPQSGIRRDGRRVLPVTGNNMEIGVKRDWFGGRWNSTASVYRILKNNQTSADPGNTPSETFVVQFGQTETQGVELDIRGEIVPGLSLIANYAYTDSRITKADTSEIAQATIGDKVPGYAAHTANAWLNYRVRRGVLQGLGVNAGFSYLGSRTTWSWGKSGELLMPDYFRLDGGLSYERGRITITANVFNLLDKYLFSGAYYGWGGYYYWQTEAGRNQRIGLSYRF